MCTRSIYKDIRVLCIYIYIYRRSLSSMTRLYLEAVVSTPKARALISNTLLVIDIWRLWSLRSINI